MCQAYHWSLDEAFRLSMPQIIMLNHAAWVNQKRAEKRSKREEHNIEVSDDAPRRRKPKRRSKLEKDPFIPSLGKKMSECTTEEIFFYFQTPDPGFENF